MAGAAVVSSAKVLKVQYWYYPGDAIFCASASMEWDLQSLRHNIDDVVTSAAEANTCELYP
jgi:hypothetical protein